MKNKQNTNKVFNYYKNKAVEGDQTSEDFQQPILNYFLKTLSLRLSFTSWRILDFGTGIGRNLSTLANYFSRIETADVNYNLTLRLQRKFPKFKHHLLKTNEITLQRNSYDLIVATEVLEHIPCFQETIDQFYYLLKKGGYLFISTPNYFNLAGLYKWFIDSYKKKQIWNPWDTHQQGYERAMSYWTLKTALKNKFTIIEVRGANLYLAWLFFLPYYFQRYKHLFIYPPFHKPLINKIGMHVYILLKKKE